MKQPKISLRTLVSLALAAAITTVFSLSAFAAPGTASGEVDPLMLQDCSGTLAVKGGSVTVNGNPAQTGATIMSGSVIATSSNGGAIIDLGPQGRIEIGDNTTVTITCTAGSVQIKSGCTKTEIRVNNGQVVVSPSQETIAVGSKKSFDGAVDLTAGAGASLSIECEGPQKTGRYIGAGWWTLILLGLGGGIAGAVAANQGDDNRPASSPARP